MSGPCHCGQLCWEQRMPQQCIALGAHTIDQPYDINVIVDAIWELKLDGDIYADGEVWVDTEALAKWLHPDGAVSTDSSAHG